MFRRVTPPPRSSSSLHGRPLRTQCPARPTFPPQRNRSARSATSPCPVHIVHTWTDTLLVVAATEGRRGSAGAAGKCCGGRIWAGRGWRGGGWGAPSHVCMAPTLSVTPAPTAVGPRARPIPNWTLAPARTGGDFPDHTQGDAGGPSPRSSPAPTPPIPCRLCSRHLPPVSPPPRAWFGGVRLPPRFPSLSPTHASSRACVLRRPVSLTTRLVLSLPPRGRPRIPPSPPPPRLSILVDAPLRRPANPTPPRTPPWVLPPPFARRPSGGA